MSYTPTLILTIYNNSSYFLYIINYKQIINFDQKKRVIKINQIVSITL